MAKLREGAKPTKSTKQASPARRTRSSPRKNAGVRKIESPAADKVKSGRVTKTQSPTQTKVTAKPPVKTTGKKKSPSEATSKKAASAESARKAKQSDKVTEQAKSSSKTEAKGKSPKIAAIRSKGVTGNINRNTVDLGSEEYWKSAEVEIDEAMTFLSNVPREDMLAELQALESLWTTTVKWQCFREDGAAGLLQRQFESVLNKYRALNLEATNRFGPKAAEWIPKQCAFEFVVTELCGDTLSKATRYVDRKGSYRWIFPKGKKFDQSPPFVEIYQTSTRHAVPGPKNTEGVAQTQKGTSNGKGKKRARSPETSEGSRRTFARLVPSAHDDRGHALGDANDEEEGYAFHLMAHDAGEAEIISRTNPKNVPGIGKVNPFYESLPGVEVWHRNVSRVFPFGETPLMAEVSSQRIADDLSRGVGKQAPESPKTAILEYISNATESVARNLGMKTARAKSPANGESGAMLPPPWRLPDVDKVEVMETMMGLVTV